MSKEIFEKVFNQIKENKKRREEGMFVNIPWLSLSKFCTVLPGIQKSRYYICTANSKVGKSQIADFLFLYEPLRFISLNPNSNIKIKILYFSLEISKEEKITQIICNKIFRDTGEFIKSDDLNSQFQNYIVENKYIELIETYPKYFELINKHVEFIDNIRNPFGIYKTTRDWAKLNGKFLHQGREVIPENEMYDTYIEKDQNLYTIVLTDHLSLLQPEKGEQLWDAMFKYSSNYCLKMRDNFKFTVVNVQQQAQDQEKQQFNFKGQSIVNKIRPSHDGLGDCKLTGRDCDCMLGLFAPYRYKISRYPENGGYDLSILKDNYRELSIILNRRGGLSISLDLYFNGKATHFEELPKPEEIDYSRYQITQ